MVENSAGQAGRRGAGKGGLLRSKPHPTLIGTLVRAGRIREAIGIGEANLTRGTATRDECEALAHAYWALGMGRSAERLAKALSQQTPTSIEGLALLGEIYAERLWASQLQAVVRRLATEARWHPQVQALSRAMETLGVEDTPPTGDDLDTRLARAEWCLRRGWIGEADAILRKLVKAHPGLERGRELLWGCQRERRLEARFGGGIQRQLKEEDEREGAAAAATQRREDAAGQGLAPATGVEPEDLDDDVEDAVTTIAPRPARVGAGGPPQSGETSGAVQRVLEAAEQDEGAKALEEMSSTTLKDLLEPAQMMIVEAAEDPHEGVVWEDADGSADDDSEGDWEDYEDDDESEDEDADSLSFPGPIRLAVGVGGGGPSPLRERLREQVVVIERGDRPRMISGDSNPKGIWFRGSGEIPRDVIDVPLSASPRRDRDDEEDAPSSSPAPREMPIQASGPERSGDVVIGDEPSSRVGRFGFDDDEDDDEGATEVVDLSEIPKQAARRVSLSTSRLQPGLGHPRSRPLEEAPTEELGEEPGPEQWDEGPTRAFVDEMLDNAFVEEDPATRIVHRGDVSGPEHTEELWEGEVATRVAGLDEINHGRRSPSPGEATRRLPGRGPVAGPDERTLPLPAGVGPDEVTAPVHGAMGRTATVPLAQEHTHTHTAPRTQLPLSRRSPLAVPEEPSILASPALWLSVVACCLVAGLFYSWTQSQFNARLTGLATQVEVAALRGEPEALNAAEKATQAFLAAEHDGPPQVKTLQARLLWRRAADIGGGALPPPGASELRALEETQGVSRDLAIARAHRDRFVGDVVQGKMRAEEALRLVPQSPLVALALARLYLEESPPQTAAAADLLTKARGWVDGWSGAPEMPGVQTEGTAIVELIKAELAYGELLVAEARGDWVAARQQLAALEGLNPEHPWLGVHRAYVSVPADASPAQTLEILAMAQTGLTPSTPPRPRAWLLLKQMEIALLAGDMGAAVTLAERAAASDPGWPEALWRSAQAHSFRGDQDQALTRIQQAGVLAPLNVDILEDRVALLLDAQSYGEAELLLAAIPDPLAEDPSVLRARAQVSLARRETGQAEKSLAGAQRKGPDDPRTLLLQSLVGTKLEGRRSGRPPLEALLKRPEVLGVGLSHAHLKAHLSGLSSGGEARSLEKEALAAAPRDPVVLEILAQNDEARGDTRGALTHLRAAHSLAPERLRATLLLARLEAVTGQADVAATRWEGIKDGCVEGPLCNEVATLVQSKPSPSEP